MAEHGHRRAQLVILPRRPVDRREQNTARGSVRQDLADDIAMASKKERGCPFGVVRLAGSGLRRCAEEEIRNAAERRCHDDERALVTCDETDRPADAGAVGKGRSPEPPDLELHYCLAPVGETRCSMAWRTRS